MLDNINLLQTESRNPVSSNIDTVSTLELCAIINDQDAQVATAVRRCLPAIAATIDAIHGRVRPGGRVLSFGAGTSGRLGVLDAAELPPTYNSDPNQYVATQAGGVGALSQAFEGAEDSPDSGASDLQALDPTRLDTVVGIAASGCTPYVLGALRVGKSVGCLTVGIACVSPSIMRTEAGLCDHIVECVTGAEVVTGSTRMKAGTATKMILNMISTGLMIKLGKTHSNLMVDVRVSNAKLRCRAHQIFRSICTSGIRTLPTPSTPSTILYPSSAPPEVLEAAMDNLIAYSEGDVKLAVFLGRTGCSLEEGKARLHATKGVLAKALEEAEYPKTAGKSEGARVVLCVNDGRSKPSAVNAVIREGEALGWSVSMSFLATLNPRQR